MEEYYKNYQFDIKFDYYIRNNVIKEKSKRIVELLKVYEYMWNKTNNIKYLKLSVKYGCLKSNELLGDYYHNKNNINLALKYYKNAIYNKNSDLMFKIGLLYQKLNKKCCKIYYKLAYNFGNINSLILLSRCYQEEKKINLSKKCLKIASFNNNSYAMMELGIIYKNEKNYKNMEYCFLCAFELNNPSAIIYLCSHYEENEMYNEMIKMYELDIKKNNNVDSIIDIADYYYSLNNEISINYYKDALKQNVVSPNLVEYYYENLHNNNNYEELEKLYNSLIPKKLSNIMHGKILYKLGKYYFNDNLTKSIELYIKSTSYENSNAMYELSIYYKSLNEIEKYIKYFNMAYDLNNENAKNNYNEFKEIKNKYLQNKKVIKQNYK